MLNKKLVLNKEWCKGCRICEEYCPKGVLKLDFDKMTIGYPEKCIFCGLCELRCPDYAIYIDENTQG